MKSTIRLFFISITIVVLAMGWITGQLENQKIQILIGVLAGLSVIIFPLTRNIDKKMDAEDGKKASSISFSHREKKSGLDWGGGNIKFSKAKRGNRRKFMGK